MLLEEKVKIFEVPDFSILPYTLIENSEISESVLLLQILTIVLDLDLDFFRLTTLFSVGAYK